MLCPNCETDNREGAKFCDQCGYPLATAADGAAEPDAEPDAESPVVQPDASAREDAQEPALDDAAPDSEEPDDESIETDYELYQPVESEETDSFDPATADDKLEFAESGRQIPRASGREYDLTGFDRHSEEYTERIVSSDYEMPAPAFRDGDTMQMPKVEGEEGPKSREYLASSTTKQKGKGKYVAIIIAAIAAALAVAALATYQMGVWGGKVVPDVVGMTEQDARSVLTDAGFSTRTEQVKSDDTEGLVLIMDPSANSRANEGSEIVIHIAATRTVPDVKGKTQKEAEELLKAEGYTSIKTVKENSDKEEGTVIAVSPKVGERAKSTAEITLTLAQPYVVPDVSGMLYDDAVAALTDAGLGYDVAYIETDAYPEGTIFGSEPAAGSSVTKGTYVVMQIAQGHASSLEDLASAELAPGSSVDVGGSSYIIESLDSVSYEGDNTVSFTATAHEYLEAFGNTIENPVSETISGTVVFNEDGELVEIM